MRPRYFLFAAAAVFAFLSFLQEASADSIEQGYIKKNALVTDYFRIEYSALVENLSDSDLDGTPDVIETVRDAAEQSRDTIIGELGYKDPMADSSNKLIIILDDTYDYHVRGELGTTNLLSNGDPFIALDPWLDRNSLLVTVAHEFFHTVQFAYSSDFMFTNQGLNWAEASATWSEDLVFDWINTYIDTDSLSDFFDYPDYSVFASGFPTTTFKYGLNIWPRFLSEYYSVDTVKDIWEEYIKSSFNADNNLKLYYAVLHVVNNKGDDFPKIFQEFTLWNLDLSKYEEGAFYPEVFSIEGILTGPFYILMEGYDAPELFATNYLYFDNVNKESDFYLHIVKPEGVSFAVSLVPSYDGIPDSDKASSVIIDREDNMNDYLELSGLTGADRVYAVISPLSKNFDSDDNTGVFDSGYSYYYSADYSNGSNFSSMDGAENLIPDGDVTDKTSGEGASQFSLDSLFLSISDYNEDSVMLSWNRLPNNEITSYEICYGNESGNCSRREKVEKSYLTSVTISGLDEGESYYFVLHALDMNGDDVVDASQEVAVTTQKWIFSDVSFMNKYANAISVLTEDGILDGYSDGSFRPNGEINRAELLKVLIEARGIMPDEGKYNNCFPDVNDGWYAPFVCYAKEMGWVEGYSDGLFRPSSSVNKVEALKILFQVYEAGLSEENPVASLRYPDVDTNAWYAIYVWKASVLGILEETPGTNFNPSSYSTRGGVSEEVYRYLVGMGEM